MDAILYPQESHFDDTSFPLKASHYSQRVAENHYHDFYELVIVLNGSGQHIANGKRYPIYRGDVFVIKPFLEHTYEDTHDLQIENILFIPEALDIPYIDVKDISGYFALFDAEPLLREKHDFKSRLTLNKEQLMVVTQIISKLHYELKESHDGYRFMATAHFMQLIGYLSRCYSNLKQKHSQKLLQISSMIDYIETNFFEDINLQTIAAKGKVSVRTANRMFQETLNISPVDYLIKIRINNARKLLQAQPCTVAEAAFKSGFNDSNYFAKQFKKIIGQSPSVYKKSFK
jgi:AraC-like DNA-binding protein